MSEDRIPFVALRGITEWSSGFFVLDDSDILAHRIEVVALVGGNIVGDGEILIQGKPANIHGLLICMIYGISRIFQELSLSHNLSAVENFSYGSYQKKQKIFDTKGLNRQIAEYGIDFFPRCERSDSSDKGSTLVAAETVYFAKVETLSTSDGRELRLDRSA